MKYHIKIVSLIFVIIMGVMLCGCDDREIYYDTDDVYFNYSELSDFSKDDLRKFDDTVPELSEVLGVYYVTGTDGSSNATMGWKIYLQQKDNLLFMQAFENGTEYGDINEEELKRINSSYDNKTGEYTQTFQNEQYVSAFNAKFKKDTQGRIKISVSRRSQIMGEYEYVSAINASGFKEQ